MKTPNLLLRLLALACVAVAVSLTAGCQTANPDADSEIPWNIPQDWESSPMVPGMSGAR